MKTFIAVGGVATGDQSADVRARATTLAGLGGGDAARGPGNLVPAAVGSQLRACVNGNLQFEVTDSTHARGQTGIVTCRTAAEFGDYRAIQP